MVSEEKKEAYSRYIKEITPQHNLFLNMLKAFVSGGAVCLFAQFVTDFLVGRGMEKEEASLWTLLVLIALAVLLTGLHLFGPMVKFAGAGLLVPITGFANSVASPSIEFAAEGEVYGKGVQCFSIAGPVILYGIVTSWGIGVLYWIGTIMGIAG